MQKIKISPELSHLIKAALHITHDLSFGIYKRPVHWDRLAKLANWHQVRPLLFDYIQQNKLEGIPKKNLQSLHEYSLGQAVTNMAFLGVSLKLYKQLIENHVPAFLMKGALWAWMLYDKPGNREFGDIDFFIDKDSIKQSLKILSDNGFEPDHYRSYLLSRMQVARQYLNTDYQLPLNPINENILQSLEIQWDCSYPRYCYHFSWTEIASDMTEFSMSGALVKIPGMENQLLMMMIHHGGVEQWDKLKYMADFIRLLRLYADKLDWNYISETARKKGFNRLLLESLNAVNIITAEDYLKYLNPEAPFSPSASFFRNMISHWENERPAIKTKSWRILLYNLQYRDNWKIRFSIIAAHLLYISNLQLIWHKIIWYRKNRF
ncbi:nucleotidyltransferase domain-containing protein [Dyadobacter flavalbus]|nr:nucleotidyltransferase family protein [Dyadobacter flavalbus]